MTSSEAAGRKVLRKAPSWILNGQQEGGNELSSPGPKSKKISGLGKTNSFIEGVPDSEEERVKQSQQDRATSREVIEISSDEDEPFSTTPVARSKAVPERLRIPGSWPNTPPQARQTNAAGLELTHEMLIEDTSDDISDIVPLRTPKIRSSRKRRIVLDSSESSEDEDDASSAAPLFDDEYVVDDAILVLNEPRSSKKPVPRKPSATPSAFPFSSPAIEALRQLPSAPKHLPSDPRPVAAKPASTPRSKTAPAASTSKGKGKGKGKKAQEEARRADLAAYAEKWFDELNRDVFENKLPATQLVWNKKLLSTAGKAQFSRNRNGEILTCMVELATKILDSEDRVRRTLSHEMCHLASWIISGKKDEQHGKIFKGWAALLMKKRPGVTISTTHNYEISYPFEYKCTNCGKIYGRFSKSIDVNKQGCGRQGCEGERLIPLFKTRGKNNAGPGTPQKSRMTADKPRDSPRRLGDAATTVDGTPQPPAEVVRVRNSDRKLSGDSSDSDIEILMTNLASTTIR